MTRQEWIDKGLVDGHIDEDEEQPTGVDILLVLGGLAAGFWLMRQISKQHNPEESLIDWIIR